MRLKGGCRLCKGGVQNMGCVKGGAEGVQGMRRGLWGWKGMQVVIVCAEKIFFLETIRTCIWYDVKAMANFAR